MSDLISRQAVQEMVDRIGGMYPYRQIGNRDSYSQYNEAWTDAICRVDAELNSLPSAQPESQWIPVTERLPENNDPVNVTWVNHNPEVYYMDIKDKPFTATAHYHRGYWYWYSSVTQDNLDEYGTWVPDLVDKDVEITAWMPLPEPWKGEDHETCGR